MREIEEDHYNVSERVIVKRLTRRGYKRAKGGKRLFVLDGNNKDDTTPNDTKVKAVNILSAEEIKKLKELVNNYDDIMYMLSMYSKSDNKHVEDINNIEDIQIIKKIIDL